MSDEEEEEESYDDFDHVFLDPREELRKPQNSLPSDPDELRVWRVVNLERAFEKRAEIAIHTRELELGCELAEKQRRLDAVEAFERRFACCVRMYDLPALIAFCNRWHDTPFTEANRITRQNELMRCNIHFGTYDDMPVTVTNTRPNPGAFRYFPQGSPRGKTVKVMYDEHYLRLARNLGYFFVDFEVVAPSIYAQQLRIAYMTRLWSLSTNSHTNLKNLPVEFEDDKRLIVFKKEARALLRVVALLLKQFHVFNTDLKLLIFSQLYNRTRKEANANVLDPTFLNDLHDEFIGDPPHCIARVPREILSLAKQSELDAMFKAS